MIDKHTILMYEQDNYPKGYGSTWEDFPACSDKAPFTQSDIMDAVMNKVNSLKAKYVTHHVRKHWAVVDPNAKPYKVYDYSIPVGKMCWFIDIYVET